MSRSAHSHPNAPPSDDPGAIIASPRWGAFTKLLVSLVLAVLAGALLVRFQQMIAPIALAVILVYLLRPVASALTARTRLSWHAAVGLVYLAIVIFVVVLLSAPILATLRLFGRYVYHKLLDLDPWPDPPPVTHPVEHVWLRWVRGRLVQLRRR